jgi:hypothetical protein
MYDKKSGLTFLQRSGLIPTHLNPEPRIEPKAFLVHSYPIEPPLPLPETVHNIDGDYAPPDRGQTLEWPHPSEDEQDG